MELHWVLRIMLTAVIFTLATVYLAQCVLTYESYKSTTRLPASIIDQVRRKPFLSINYIPGMGLGNQLFVYASLYGLAKMQRRNAVLRYRKDYSLNKWFTLSIPILPDYKYKQVGWYTYTDEHACKVTNMTMHLPATNTYLRGYYQVYRYFESVADELRKNDLQFESELLHSCQQRIRDVAGNESTKCVYVGVHTRRGDYLTDGSYRWGYVAADADYLSNATEHFRQKFADVPCIRFLVLGNNETWNQENMPDADDIGFVMIMKPQSAISDLCVLAQCNHTIMTTGSFGWWAGFLANGHTVYQKNAWRPGSRIDQLCKAEDYFPPNWMAL